MGEFITAEGCVSAVSAPLSLARRHARPCSLFRGCLSTLQRKAAPRRDSTEQLRVEVLERYALLVSAFLRCAAQRSAAPRGARDAWAAHSTGGEPGVERPLAAARGGQISRRDCHHPGAQPAGAHALPPYRELGVRCAQEKFPGVAPLQFVEPWMAQRFA